jgi:hypothetical protein
MRAFFLNRMLRRLEREANDELLQVLTLGPHHYSTPELYNLLEQLELQKKIVAAKMNRHYRLGAAVPLLIAATFLLGYFEARALAFLSLALIPLTGGLFTYRMWRLRREHPTYHDSAMLERLIRQELHRRESSSIF